MILLWVPHGGPVDQNLEQLAPGLDEGDVAADCGTPSPSGHVVELVHDASASGTVQAAAEGVEMLRGFEHDLDLPALFHHGDSGTVLRSWLVDRMGRDSKSVGRRATGPERHEHLRRGHRRGEVGRHVGDRPRHAGAGGRAEAVGVSAVYVLGGALLLVAAAVGFLGSRGAT